MKGTKITIDCQTGKEIIEEVDFPEPTAEELAQRQREEALANLAMTDSYMARITEDLMSLLVSKGVVALTDLPLAVQVKLNERKTLRKKLGGQLEKTTT